MTRRQIARGFVSQLQKKSFKEAVNELAALIITEKKTREIPLQLEEIRNELERAQGHVSADVTTARPLSAHLEKEIATLLQKKTSAKTVDINNIVDQSIKGGFIARTSQYELDASITGKLAQLKGAIR